MSAYLPSGLPFLLRLAALLGLAFAVGFALPRWAPPKLARTLAWGLLIAGAATVHGLAGAEPPGVRMLALIAIALIAMKTIVVVEEHGAAHGKGSTRARETPLTLGAWMSFMGWVGMQPRLFATTSRSRPAVSGALALRGMARLAVGLALVALARLSWTRLQNRLAVSILLLTGLSLVLHFGLLNLLAVFWRRLGIAVEPPFRAPLRSQSLSEFWSRRWNRAFSEMTSIAVYRPLARALGPPAALLASFLVSGLLHELAISLPVRAGYGRPTLYFTLHGLLVLMERRLSVRGTPIGGWMGRAWTVTWLVLPLPLLFHRPFLAGVVWPLIGITETPG